MSEWVYNNLFLSYAIWASLCLFLLFGLLAWRWLRDDEGEGANHRGEDSKHDRLNLYDDGDEDFSIF